MKTWKYGIVVIGTVAGLTTATVDALDPDTNKREQARTEQRYSDLNDSNEMTNDRRKAEAEEAMRSQSREKAESTHLTTGRKPHPKPKIRFIP